jgi:SAM-dependent methyltransferase
MRTVNIDSLEITTKHYYYKPVQAFFRALEIHEYLKTGLRLKPLVMDLGCGDGTFGSMLQESGIVNSIRISLDFSLRDIMRGKKKNELQGGIQADVRNVPLKNGALSSVFSNGVICCLRSENDIDNAFFEVHRVLQDQGLFLVSVPTVYFNDNLLWPKILTKIGMHKIASNYLLRLNRRLTHEHTFQEAEWRAKLETAGFSIEHVRYYFTPRQAYWWNILSLRFLQVFAILQMLGFRLAQQSARFQKMIFRPVFEQELSVPQAQKQPTAGYLLLVARKLAN